MTDTSAAAGNLDTGQEDSQDGLHVTAVKVDFPSGRPKEKLELIVRLNARDYKIKIGKQDEVRWSGNVHCLLPSTVRVSIRCLNPLMPINYASVQASLSLSLSLSSLSDPMQRISVTFTISESSVESRAEAAKEQRRVEKTEAISKTLVKVWSVITFVHPIVRETPNNTHPAADPPPGMKALRSLMKACENQESCRDEALDLVNEFEPFVSVYGHEEQLKQRVETRRAAVAMLRLIEKASRYILQRTTSRVIGDQIGARYLAILSKIKTRFARARKAFDDSVKTEVFKAFAGVERNMQFVILRERLSGREDAHFAPGKDSSCLEGTRVDLLARIKDWVAEEVSTQRSVFWLRGMVGSGKSTVANTVAQAIQDSGCLLSCFFCKRDNVNLSNPRLVLPTLAFRFAQHHDSYRASIFPLIHTDPRGTSIGSTANIGTQFDKLFQEPLPQTVDPLRFHVVVIDALDECGTSKEQTSLARCILALSSLAPWIKVFVTSRDEPAIRKVFTEYACTQCNINDEEGTDDDIKQYVESQAQELEFTLSGSDAGQLVRRAEGLFIWCNTLFKFLGKCHDPKEELDSFLRGKEQKISWRPLYQLYDKVLESAAETKKDASFTRDVLAVVAVAADNCPLSAKTIASFLRNKEWHSECREDHVQRVVAKLHAVLYVEGSVRAAIRACHSSFYDFLHDKATEAGSNREWLAVVHGRMARICITTLTTQLRFNMCNIERPVMNKDIPDLSSRVAKNISEELQYSSRFWFTHVSPSNLAQSDIASGVRELLCSRKILFWLEALSLQGSLMQYSPAFAVCSSFFQGYPDIVTAANDAHRFVTAFSAAMDSVPHIYLSSLFWLPRDSLTYRNLELSKLTHIQLIRGKRDHWDAVIWERSIGGELRCVEYSPDGQHIACGADDGRIHLLNAHTGAREGEPLQGHSDIVLCLAYSPNGRFIASCSWDDTVRIWDAKSGEPVFDALVGHTDTVNSVAWSLDGKSIASCSNDGTVRIWNTQTGVQEGEALQSRVGMAAVVFTLDGTQIVAGGDDGAIRIWATDTYQEVRQPLHVPGALLDIQSLKCTPDGHIVAVSGLYDKSGEDMPVIRVWNAQVGETVGQPPQTRTIVVKAIPVTRSLIDQFIVSGASDYTVRVWDVASGALVGEPLRGHTDSVTSVSCSPDGLSIASVSEDGTIHVWETPTGSRAQEQAQGHSGFVCTVAFSPDGQHITTGCDDGSIRLWDAETGALIGEPLRGHERGVSSIAYSLDGQSIASGSSDKTVRVWNAKTGEAVGEPLQGHSNLVESVAYSPSGSLIASASYDHTVRLWDVQTGCAIGEPLQIGEPAWSVAFSPDGHSLACGFGEWDWARGILVLEISSTVSVKMTLCGHSGPVFSVAFSPNGQYIASGSGDGTVRIWDAQTGEPHGSPLTGHVESVPCVAFSLDSRLLASGSWDGIVRLWDVRNGQVVGDPLRGHSDGLVSSVVFSPDDRSLASADSERICVYTMSGARHSNHSLGDSEAEAHWLRCCSHMNEQDGWVKDGDTLLLWIPPPYRHTFKCCTRFVINKSGPRAGASRVDHDTLSRYTGTEWVNILSDL